MSSYMWELKDKNKDYFKWGYLAKLKSIIQYFVYQI